MRKKYSREHRRKIGEAVSRRAAEFPKDLPEKRRCSNCEEWKPAKDFVLRKRKLKSGEVSLSLNAWCRKCTNTGVREWRAAKQALGEMAALQQGYQKKWYSSLSNEGKEAKNRYQREWMAARRREEDRPVRGPRQKALPPNKSESVPVAAIVAFLREEMERWEENLGGPVNGLLAEKTGVSQRRLYALLEGEQSTVAIATVDKLLTGLGLPHMLSILYPEE